MKARRRREKAKQERGEEREKTKQERDEAKLENKRARRRAAKQRRKARKREEMEKKPAAASAVAPWAAAPWGNCENENFVTRTNVYPMFSVTNHYNYYYVTCEKH